MADSFVTHTGNGTAGPFSFSALDYLSADHLAIKVDGTTKTITTHYTVDSSAETVTFTSGNFPIADAVIKIQRSTPRTKATRVVDFADGAVLTEADLDNAHLQNLYIAQEAFETSDSTILYDDTLGAFDADSEEIKALADPTTDASAVTRKYVTDVASFGVPGVPQQHNEVLDGSTGTTTPITLTDWTGVEQNMILVSLDGLIQIPGTDFTIVASGDDTLLTIVGGDPDSGVVFNAQNFGVQKNSTTVAEDSIDSAHIASGAVDLDHLNSTGGSEAVNTTVIRDDAVTSAKIADDSVDFDRLKDTAFTDAPGASTDHALMIAHATGNLSTRLLVAADISNFQEILGASSISNFGVPTGDVAWGAGSGAGSNEFNKITNLKDPTSAPDAAPKTYVDTLPDVSRWSSNDDVAFTGKVLDVSSAEAQGTETLLGTQAVTLPSATSRLTGFGITCTITSLTETLGGSNDPAVQVVYYPRFYNDSGYEITHNALGYAALPALNVGTYDISDHSGSSAVIAHIASSDNAVTLYSTPWGVSGLYNLSAGGTYGIATVKVYALTLTNNNSAEGSETVTLAGNINVQHTHKP